MEKENKKLNLKIIIPVAILIIIAIIAVVINSKSNDGENNKVAEAIVIDNNGIKKSMSIQELFEIYDSNEENFKKNYAGAKIEFTGTVEKIKTNTSVVAGRGSVTSNQKVIYFEEGWALIIGNFDSIDLSNYKKGTKLKVTTGIVGAPFDTDFLKQVSENKRVMWLVGQAYLFKYNSYIPIYDNLVKDGEYYYQSTGSNIITTIEEVK